MDENKPKSKRSRSLLKIAIILGILALVALVAIPNFIRARSTTASNACMNNLRLIDGAKQQWALEYNKADTAAVITWDDVKPYLGREATGSLDSLHCQDDRARPCSDTYTLGNVQTKPKCKINPAAHKLD